MEIEHGSWTKFALEGGQTWKDSQGLLRSWRTKHKEVVGRETWEETRRINNMFVSEEGHMRNSRDHMEDLRFTKNVENLTPGLLSRVLGVSQKAEFELWGIPSPFQGAHN